MDTVSVLWLKCVHRFRGREHSGESMKWFYCRLHVSYTGTFLLCIKMAVIPTQLCSVVVKGLKLKLGLHLIYILIVLIQSIQGKITQKSVTVPKLIHDCTKPKYAFLYGENVFSLLWVIYDMKFCIWVVLMNPEVSLKQYTWPWIWFLTILSHVSLFI